MRKITDWIEGGLEKVCNGVAYLPIVIFIIISIEVVSRYFFDNPTSWAWIVTQQLFLVLCLFGGIYAFIKGDHIRIEMLYDKFPPALRLACRMLALALFVVFAGVFVWKSVYMAKSAIAGREIARGAFPMPIYLFKGLMPIVGALFLLQGIISITKEK
jgi:TRAP-type C4-dicarboxylate transport system permease small subunit